jgi:CelD/BcsL family acetyltransferase involved in cellulose biosynthesis
MAKVTTRVISSFDDPGIDRDIWNSLLCSGDTDTLQLTWQYQRLWWQQNRKNSELQLIVAEKNGVPIAIAPLFFKSGMIMNLCPICGLDFIGDISDPEIADAILLAAMGNVPEFVGFCFYFIPDASRTERILRDAAKRLDLNCMMEDEQPSPIIDIKKYPEEALACTKKKLMVRRENKLRREGKLEILRYSAYSDIEWQLDLYFDQHIERWKNTPTPSKFLDGQEQEFFRDRMKELSNSGWLRFTCLEWNDIPIAFHQGSCYKRHFIYGRTTYDPQLSEYSPGTVLLRHVMLEAISEDAEIFDFGFGAEDYKYRYANDEIKLKTWGLYR